VPSDSKPRGKKLQEAQLEGIPENVSGEIDEKPKAGTMKVKHSWHWFLGIRLVAFLAIAASGVSAADDRPCCGPVTLSGWQLANMLDHMNVEEHWPAHEHVNWETGDPDRGGEYEGPGHTHCSAFAAAAAKRLVIYLLRPPQHDQKLLANAQVEWLASSEGRERGWSAVKDGREAQTLANQGNLVVAVFANPNAKKPGHVAIVRPSEKTTQALRHDGPQIIQAGTHNHNSTVVRIGFESHPGAFPNGIRYYVHPVQDFR
jgi:hypothetical protein